MEQIIVPPPGFYLPQMDYFIDSKEKKTLRSEINKTTENCKHETFKL